MNCKETQEVIQGYVDGELDVIHNLAVEQHLRECAVCAGALRGQQSLRKAMSSRSLGSNNLSSQARSSPRILPASRSSCCAMM